MSENNNIFNVNCEKLDDFFTDSFYFRDAKAYSKTPALSLFEWNDNKNRIFVRDKFTLHHKYTISKESGEQFVDVTGDDNVIHKDHHNIVPGAMTVSKIIAPLEILIPNLEILDVNIKFLDFSYYSKKTHNVFFWKCINPENICIDVSTYQEQDAIAKTVITGSIKEYLYDVPKIKEKAVNKKNLAMVHKYFESLGVESKAYFQKDGYMDYTYPIGFISSMPSAKIVREMGGQGGMINVLKMNFGNHERIPIKGKSDIGIKLERGKKRNTFNKIMTEITNGFVTYYRGLAIVNPVAGFA